jgi:hypothetical protein
VWMVWKLQLQVFHLHHNLHYFLLCLFCVSLTRLLSFCWFHNVSLFHGVWRMKGVFQSWKFWNLAFVKNWVFIFPWLWTCFDNNSWH